MAGTGLVSTDQRRPFLLSPKGELLAAVIAGAMLLAGWMLRTAGEAGGGVHLAGELLAWGALVIGLFHGMRAALAALGQGTFDIDVLMVVGAVLAAWIGAPAEGALLLFLFTLSGALEDLAMARTTRAVEALHRLMPTAAQRLENGAWVKAEPESLVAGNRVKILPGEAVPTDCRLVLGESSIDQSSITGESQPRHVFEGDELYAGTINVGNPVEAIVLRPAAQSSLQKILDLVIQAQQQREPVQRIIDRVSQPYAIGVFAASLAVFAIWHWGIGRDLRDAMYTAITLLIVASPCALIISTPTATLAAISRAARTGVLFKGGQSIDRLSRARAIAFDKTGTLTIGRPRVMHVEPVAWSAGPELLAVAAALEGGSTHPIAAAIIEAATQQGLAPAPAEAVKYITGRGIVATVEGKPARIGSLHHTEELIPVCLRAQVRAVLKRVQHQGQIAVVCAWNEQAAVIILADAARPGADCLTARLHEINVRPVVMLTGDNRLTAATVAERLGLDDFHAELMPADKVSHVQRLKREVGPTAVIGDGVNDAPALAAADVSIAIGSIGSDAALESADAVLLADDLLAVPWAIRLARRCRRTVMLNLTFALGAMAVMAVATIVGSLVGRPVPLWLGVVGHEGGTLLVVCNSLLLLTVRGFEVCTCDRQAAEPLGQALHDGPESAALEHAGAPKSMG